MNKKYKLLITGGAGFIGSNLVEHFLQDERVSLVRVLDDLWPRRRRRAASGLSLAAQLSEDVIAGW